jgi:hypothetical protein
MRRTILIGLVSLLAAAASAEGQTTSSNLTVTLRITQGVTQRQSHPPAGDAGDLFSVVLSLYNTTPQFGKAADAPVGNMTFSYTLKGSCSAAGGACKGTADILTVTKLPGGTITAGGTKVPIRTPFLVTVRTGTGRFAGAHGTVEIAPAGAAKNIYKLKLP